MLPQIRKHLPDTYTSYYEPFIGGAALLLDIQPKHAVVNDVNGEIINIYEVIRDHADALIGALKKHKNEREYFYKQREIDRTSKYAKYSKIERAARIIFLNKTCYNGLFRVNGQGQFNVPYGKYANPNIVNEAGIRAVQKYFRSASLTFTTGDFESALGGIKKHAFVYFDPPYHPLSTTSSFTGYAHGGFGEADQTRLRDLCNKLDKQGCKFLLSNSYCDFICDLYRDYEQVKIEATRNINSVGAGRGKIFEVLIRNYE